MLDRNVSRTSISVSVQRHLSPALWEVVMCFFKDSFRVLDFTMDKSKSLSFWRAMFQIVLMFAQKPWLLWDWLTSSVFFLLDIVKRLWTDEGVLYFNILNAVRIMWYIYALCTVRISFELNKGLLSSFLKNSLPRFIDSIGLVLAQVLNLFRYASSSPKSIRRHFFWALKRGSSFCFDTPPQTVIP